MAQAAVPLDEERFETASGWIGFPPWTSRVIAYEVHGHLTLPMAQAIFRRYERFAATVPGPHEVFADFSQMTQYDTDARVAAASWFKERVTQFAVFHALVGSKLAALGWSTIALFSRLTVKSYSDRAAFEAARRGARPG